jgi:hypothetical protein
MASSLDFFLRDSASVWYNARLVVSALWHPNHRLRNETAQVTGWGWIVCADDARLLNSV